MAKIKDLDGRVENRVRERKRKREGKEVVEEEKHSERKEIRGGDRQRESPTTWWGEGHRKRN